MWEQMVERPAMATATWAPRSAATRVGDILTAGLWNMLEAARGKDEDEQRIAGLRLWSLPTLLLRRDAQRSRGRCEEGKKKRRDRGQESGKG